MTKAALAEGNIVHFWCPACDDAHMIRFGGDGWTWNGDLEAPTFTPSVKVTGVQWEPSYPFFKPRHRVPPGKPICCHSFVTAGRIEFCGDSTHDLAGQTVDLPEWPYGDELEAPEVPEKSKGSTMTTTIQGNVAGLNLDPASGNTVATVNLSGGTVTNGGDSATIVGGQLVIVLDSAAGLGDVAYGSTVTISVANASPTPAPAEGEPTAEAPADPAPGEPAPSDGSTPVPPEGEPAPPQPEGEQPTDPAAVQPPA